MRSSVSCVASTAPWPARAWSLWACVMTAFSTAAVGSIWKPPILQQIPAGVRRRMSSGRIALRYDANDAMTGALGRTGPPSSEEGYDRERCLEGGSAGGDSLRRESGPRATEAVHLC